MERERLRDIEDHPRWRVLVFDGVFVAVGPGINRDTRTFPKLDKAIDYATRRAAVVHPC